MECPICPNPRHLLVTRPEVLKARIGGVFSKRPEWSDVIIPFVTNRLALLLVGWLGFRLLPLPVTFPSAWEIGPRRQQARSGESRFANYSSLGKHAVALGCWLVR